MKILVTGGHGLVGKALGALGDVDHTLILVGRKQYNLTNLNETAGMMETHKPDAIIHLAAKVGGVKGNMDYPADFFYENIRINTNVLHCAHVYNIKKVVSMLSTCIFPEEVFYPIKESSIHDGPPHDSNFAYSYAKRMLEVQSKAYNRQYGNNFITVVPNNLFGEHDNFHLNDSHVIPAMIRKFHDAVINNKEEIELWGDGSPLREFTYSKDIARQLLFVLERYNEDEPINLGVDEEISIRYVAQTLKRVSGYKGNIVWNVLMPSGQYRKPSDKTKIKQLGWESDRFTEFTSALCDTYAWYERNYPSVRGV